MYFVSCVPEMISPAINAPVMSATPKKCSALYEKNRHMAKCDNDETAQIFL